MKLCSNKRKVNEMDKIATRQAYGEALAEFGAVNDKIIVLDADLSKSTKTDTFKKKFPERFINCGIAEGNMMAVAAGMASTGKIVFASSFAMFAAGRAFEQIRNCAGYGHLNLKIGASHAGISVGEDGATHQCNEDLALMRTIPGMTVICPSDAIETRLAVKAAIEIDGPVYLRVGRLPVLVINDVPGYKFEVGKGTTLHEGKDVSIIATGLMVGEALKASEILKEQGISARVINIHTIKPIDVDIIRDAAIETGVIVTAEEHTIIGGLGSAVAETVCELGLPVPVIRVGVNDTFGKSGKAEELLHVFGLDADNIVKNCLKAIKMKK